ncbi:MAG: tRNA 4-thiouridine(8) synthase ThiI [Desulfobacula sp.]|uniref:tRNA 4-thiouridine(8) synthase ThiI n=1 Tax=Desulfobacula sp. TaxID=2593537 RepID=UPI0025C35ABC|nr:tRNA 4-thiouridine(8) synthase ThiI [Desulfobacula sp.]MCD4719228.1 tRNA 4-thiouridine(8) synthase ThiI [Desulfobacula sp.]
MKIDEISSQTKDQAKGPIKGLGLCSGGLDSILSALLLQRQGIDVTWICFETPFFSSESAQKASLLTGIPLITIDITDDYMEMMKNPKAGFGKNMNPCMDCHALMFSKAGEVLKNKDFHFLFSGEVLGQRPKSQNKNSLRYVEKNSGFEGRILRPLCAKLLPATLVEQNGLVNREKLLDISGRSRKIQMQMARDFGIKEYPAPAGGCLLTDKIFSDRLQDLMNTQKKFNKRELYYLKYGRHFRLDQKTKVIVGRSEDDNKHLLRYCNIDKDILLRHARMPGPDVILTGSFTPNNIQTAAMICAAYTKSNPGKTADIRILKRKNENIITVKTIKASEFKQLMLPPPLSLV